MMSAPAQELQDWWKRCKSVVEPSSFLRRHEEDQSPPSKLAGQIIVVLALGYAEQQAKLQQLLQEQQPGEVLNPTVLPYWWSLQGQTLHREVVGTASGRRGSWLGPHANTHTARRQKLGPVEYCRIVSATFHQRPGAKAKPPSGQFVRLTLQRLLIPCELGPQLVGAKLEATPYTCTLDYHLDAAEAPFIIKRSHFEQHTLHKPWRKDDRIRMWWSEEEDRSTGQWHTGTIQAVRPVALGVPSPPGTPPARKSKSQRLARKQSIPVPSVLDEQDIYVAHCPWLQVKVQWDDEEEDEEDDAQHWASPWELQRITEHLTKHELDQIKAMQKIALPEDWSLDPLQHPDAQGKMSPGVKRKRRAAKAGLLSDGATNSHSCDVSSMPGAPKLGSQDDSVDQQREERRLMDCGSTLAPVQEVPDHGFSFWCSICHDNGEQASLQHCETCRRSFHAACLQRAGQGCAEPTSTWVCKECREDVHNCTLCAQSHPPLQKCFYPDCCHHYHRTCRDQISVHLPFSVYAGTEFICPAHKCSVCGNKTGAGGQQGASKGAEAEGRKLVRCWRCPRAYHPACLPPEAKRVAGTSTWCECPSCAVLYRLERLQQLMRLPSGDVTQLDKPALEAACRRGLQEPTLWQSKQVELSALLAKLSAHATRTPAAAAAAAGGTGEAGTSSGTAAGSGAAPSTAITRDDDEEEEEEEEEEGEEDSVWNDEYYRYAEQHELTLTWSEGSSEEEASESAVFESPPAQSTQLEGPQPPDAAQPEAQPAAEAQQPEAQPAVEAQQPEAPPAVEASQPQAPPALDACQSALPAALDVALSSVLATQCMDVDTQLPAADQGEGASGGTGDEQAAPAGPHAAQPQPALITEPAQQEQDKPGLQDNHQQQAQQDTLGSGQDKQVQQVIVVASAFEVSDLGFSGACPTAEASLTLLGCDQLMKGAMTGPDVGTDKHAAEPMQVDDHLASASPQDQPGVCDLQESRGKARDERALAQQETAAVEPPGGDVLGSDVQTAAAVAGGSSPEGQGPGCVCSPEAGVDAGRAASECHTGDHQGVSRPRASRSPTPVNSAQRMHLLRSALIPPGPPQHAAPGVECVGAQGGDDDVFIEPEVPVGEQPVDGAARADQPADQTLEQQSSQQDEIVVLQVSAASSGAAVGAASAGGDAAHLDLCHEHLMQGVVPDGSNTETAEPATVPEPAEPVTVTQPAEPVTVTEPAEPVTVTQPAEPDTVSVPAEPATATVTLPAEPATVTEPAEPAAVTVPAEPAIVTVTEPAEPATVTEPAEPATVTVPAEPATVTEPAEPATVTEPAEPATVTVTVPAEPVTVTQPAETATVTQPAEPATVTEPAEPDTVSVPAEPATATVTLPAEPATVTEPAEPAIVTLPAEPAIITVPAEPDTVTEPAEPDTVTVPAEPAIVTVTQPAEPATVTVPAEPAGLQPDAAPPEAHDVSLGTDGTGGTPASVPPALPEFEPAADAGPAPAAASPDADPQAHPHTSPAIAAPAVLPAALADLPASAARQDEDMQAAPAPPPAPLETIPAPPPAQVAAPASPPAPLETTPAPPPADSRQPAPGPGVEAAPLLLTDVPGSPGLPGTSTPSEGMELQPTSRPAAKRQADAVENQAEGQQVKRRKASDDKDDGGQGGAGGEVEGVADADQQAGGEPRTGEAEGGDQVQAQSQPSTPEEPPPAAPRPEARAAQPPPDVVDLTMDDGSDDGSDEGSDEDEEEEDEEQDPEHCFAPVAFTMQDGCVLIDFD